MDDLRRDLAELAENLRWSWDADLESVFREIDADLWREVHHGPRAFLARLEEGRLAARAADPAFRDRLQGALASLRAYLADERHWAARHAPALGARPAAYFCAEFALHESLPIYSGGLGVLAGDHLKSCSDLGVPVWGVTVLYRQGYFTQRIGPQGDQEEHYADLDLPHVPLEPVRDARGERLWIQMPTPFGTFPIDLWVAKVGRARLLLLDGSRDPAAAHRDIFASRLYGGDARTRLLQELILGAGGYRALLSMGIRPGVIHLNEGHCAFAALEAIAQTIEDEGVGFDAALDRVRERIVFTTHTPVAAGHDRFPPGLVEEFLGSLRERLGLSKEGLLGLGRHHPHDAHEPFNMTIMALRLAGHANAVSALHGRTTRRMWAGLWPGRPLAQVPIGHVTNGVHAATWTAPEMSRFFRRHLGEDWPRGLGAPDLWERAYDFDDRELWGVKADMKRALFDLVDRRLRARQDRLGIEEPLPHLDPEALTIGIAKRFVEYKRAQLPFSEPDGLARLLSDTKRPVQIVYAGKAHPRDDAGKSILRTVYEQAREPRFNGRVVVLENHDLHLARRLVQGCDLWINVPRRPLEACGTSGQKAIFNATLNLAILDGWWAEAWDGLNGYAFGEGLTHSDTRLQDRRDAIDLLEVLERQIIPDFFDRDPDGLPRRWLARIKRALATLAWRYNSDRMVKEYVTRCYTGAAGLLTSDFPPQD